ncbi:MAG: hypothetical protein KC912_14435 [Proteobacteria bacterium]|nr:hypothetical protein [Pseudomonadota bacterium]
MPLTDPELELLTELVADDPGADSFPRVGEELLRRGRAKEAYDVLRRGVGANPHLDAGWLAFVAAAEATQDYVAVLEALENVDADPSVNPDLARSRITALDRTGQATRVRSACNRFLEVHPGDAAVRHVLEMLDAPPPSVARTARDPFLTVKRAEEYVLHGRLDKAIRAYRRILHHHPRDRGLEKRLFELIDMPHDHDWLSDDLSEEILAADLTATGPAPDINMPAPSIGHPDEEMTQPHSIEEIERTLRELSRRREALMSEPASDYEYGEGDDVDDDEARTEMIPFRGTRTPAASAARRGTNKSGR